MTAPVGVASPPHAGGAKQVTGLVGRPRPDRPRSDALAHHRLPRAASRPALKARTGAERTLKRSPRSKDPLRATTTAPDPVSIRIPVLGIHQRLVQLGVVGSSLQVPDRYSDVGWWSGGPAPGEKGAAVMVGHVDSLTGPAVFYQLSGMRPGDRIVVGDGRGSRLVFGVRRVTEFAKSHFPSARVYRASGPPTLHLLTCGGSFDRRVGHYTGNVVVFASLIRRLPGPHRHRNLPSGNQQRRHSLRGNPEHPHRRASGLIRMQTLAGAERGTP